MNLTLLVESNPKIESFYMLNLSTWLGLNTVAVNRGVSAIKVLEKDPSSVHLIITRTRIQNEDSAQVIFDYLKKKGMVIPVIVIGPADKIPGGTKYHVPNSLDLKVLIKSIALALNITAREMVEKVVPDYFPIPVIFFKVLKRPPCHIFYQYDPKHPKKFKLLLEKNEELKPTFMEDMFNQGIETLFVDKMDRLEFVNNVTSEYISMLESSDLSEEEQLSAADKSLELFSKKLMTIGVTDETIALAKKTMNGITGIIKKHPKLSKLINRLLANRVGYIYQHTQILSYVALHIIRNIDWGTPEQEEKMTFITFFHDIALETDEQCKIRSNAELKKKTEFSPEARHLVEKHAQIAAEVVGKFPHSPMGADQIIRQHHGQLNGVGFSEHFGANISPIALVFIIAEEFTHIIMKTEEGAQLDRKEMLRELKDRFPTSRFSKILDLLDSITF